MAKRVELRPDWLSAACVTDVYSLSGCISADFTNYVPLWKHNGYWLFDSPELIRAVADENQTTLNDTRLFYYEVYEHEYDDEESAWKPFLPDPSLSTNVRVPTRKQLEGFDVVTFWAHSSPECSPLSCNALAKDIPTNAHCLFASFDEAKVRIDSGGFGHSEPGPYRIFAVYSVDWPNG